jgi:hypothetical protein
MARFRGVKTMNLQVAVPRDLLARAYLDMLAAEAGTNCGPLLRGGNPDDPIERLIALRRSCSVHEAGHLVVGVALAVFEPQALTILDDGGTTRVELSRANTQTEGGIENFITALLSGRAAEEIILGSSQATAAAGIGEDSDFSRATTAAIELELCFGFGVIGLARFSDRARDAVARSLHRWPDHETPGSLPCAGTRTDRREPTIGRSRGTPIGADRVPGSCRHRRSPEEASRAKPAARRWSSRMIRVTI